MVKKLYKHEIQAYLRVWIPMQIILLGVALLGRLIQLFETEGSTAYNIINGSSLVAFGLAVVVSIGLTFVFSIVRFYKNLFTAEGYLSFTLPVTPTQHIVTKLFVAVAFQLATLLMVLFAVATITAGDVFAELLKAIAYLWGHFRDKIGAHLPFYVLEVAVLVIVMLLAAILLLYMCASIGQLTNKNRVLMAVGAYFLYYLATQIVGTVVVVIGASLPQEWWQPITDYFTWHSREAMHWAFGGLIVWEALLGTAYAFVTRHILRRRLNLE